MIPIKITVEYDNGTKQVLEDSVEDWIELIEALVNIAKQQGIDVHDFNWREVGKEQ